MDPVYEQGLRDEVVYLHSLWRQGPPSNHLHHHHQFNPSSSFAARTTTASPLHHRLQPSNPTHFKKNKHKTILNLVQQHRIKHPQPQIDSGPEWPIPKSPEILSNSSSGWPPLNLPPATHLPSSEDLARLADSNMQKRTMKAARDFFAAGNEDDDDDNGEDEEGDDLMEDDERKEYNFFLNIFNEDNDLRNYYESKWKGSEFFCLVCGGIANKGSKRFKNCLALVQHSLSILKTKKKKAHRAYAEVICKVLAWDINQLPSYSSMLAKSGDSEIQTLQVVGNDSNSESMQNVVAQLHKEEIISKESFANNPTGNIGLSTGNDASKQEEETAAAAVVNQLCGKISSNMVLETGEAMAMLM